MLVPCPKLTYAVGSMTQQCLAPIGGYYGPESNLYWGCTGLPLLTINSTALVDNGSPVGAGEPYPIFGVVNTETGNLSGYISGTYTASYTLVKTK